MLNGLFENLKTASALREISIWWGIAERTVLGLGKNMSDYNINIRCKILQTIWRFLHKEVITFLLGTQRIKGIFGLWEWPLFEVTFEWGELDLKGTLENGV